ncbi:MAG: hypothetical protein HC904_07455 [Blastochloris sp.]|nr:hypothetical protein [Blastochloris sp.]
MKILTTLRARGLFLLLFCLLWSQPDSPAQTQEQVVQQITVRLKSVPLTELNYQNAPIREVLADLQKKMSSISADSPLELSYIKAPESKEPEPALTLNFKHNSLYEALNMIAMLSGLQMTIHEKGVRLQAVDALSLSSW